MVDNHCMCMSLFAVEISCICNGLSEECSPITGECVDCSLNTAGPHCDRCTAKHFQLDVNDISKGCRPCECNSNEDPFEPDMCNPRTGVCLKCANNTAGEHCGVCAPGYHGDAVNGTCKSEFSSEMQFIRNCPFIWTFFPIVPIRVSMQHSRIHQCVNL